MRATYFTAASFLLSLSLFSAETIPVAKAPVMTLAPAPDWVERTEPRLRAADAEADGEGTHYALVDSRVDVGGQHRYFRRVLQVTAAHGLQDASRISVDFDPEYQRLEWHAIRLIRGGQEFSRLSLDAIEMSRRYQELEWSIYDSSVTAFTLIDDLRVGDVIDWEYSILGFNPVYGDRFGEMAYLSWTVPVGRAVREYRLPAARTVQVRVWNGVPEGGVTRSATETVYRWMVDDVPAVDLESSAPAAWNPFARVQVSEFKSWAEVVAWAEPLYPDDPLDPAMIRGFESEDSGSDGEPLERAAHLLHLVQEDVRYLSVAVGESSHRPSPPETTLRRRFGDCKDKAYLYCTLLRAAGIRAVPVLVNTDAREAIGEWLPMPNAFDHVIVRVDLPGAGCCWVDPTRDYQGGPLTGRVVGKLKLGLPIAPEVAQLEVIEQGNAVVDRTAIEETFTIRSREEPVALQVTSVYRGAAADRMRSLIATTRRPDMSRSFVEFYSADYPQVQELEPFQVDDQRDSNVFTLREHYQIENFWVRAEAGKPYRAVFYPNAVRQYINRPTDALRDAPYVVRHPLEISQQTTVRLPEEWNSWDSAERVENDYFAMETAAKIRQRVFTYTASMKTHAEVVPGEAVPDFARDVDRARDALGYQLTWLPDDEVDVTSHPSWLRILLTPVVFLGALTGLVIWAWRLRQGPPLIRSASGPEGLGGWLVLVVVGFALRSIFGTMYLFDAAPTFYSTGIWDEAVASAEPAWQWVLDWCFWGEFVFGYACLAAAVAFFFYFFRRHRALPRIAIAGLVLNLCDSVSGTVGLFLLPGVDAAQQSVGARGLFGAVVGGGIWTIYLLVSRRVKNTFRR